MIEVDSMNDAVKMAQRLAEKGRQRIAFTGLCEFRICSRITRTVGSNSKTRFRIYNNFLGAGNLLYAKFFRAKHRRKKIPLPSGLGLIITTTIL